MGHINVTLIFPSKMPSLYSQSELEMSMPDTNVLAKAGFISVQSMIIRNHLRWAGHFACINGERILKKLFSGGAGTQETEDL